MRSRMVAVALAALVIAGCGDEEERPAADPTPAPTAEVAEYQPAPVEKDLDKEPKVPLPTGTPPVDLVIEDVVKGKGKAAKAGDSLAVQYTGYSFSTGVNFDSSWSRGAQPFEFPLGAGQVIPGWDEGLVGIRKGGRRLLVIPPDLGYGAQGAPPDIGPNETLIFVVDAVKIG